MSAPDSRPALPIHLPFDSISPSFSKNSPCVFQVLGYYLTSLGEMPCGWLLCAYFWPGMGGARNAVVRPNAFLLRKSAVFSACNAENIRKCNRHGGGAAAGVSRLSFHFLFSKNACLFAVMRPDPDLTQTGAKTRWIYRDLFDKIAHVSLFSRIF